MAVIWTFRHYVDLNGTSDVKETYDNGTPQLRSKLLSRLRTLANLPLTDWNETYRKSLKGNCDGLEEIRFKADNVQQRPLGYRSTASEFIILFWATERGGKFVPLSACEKALKRKTEVLLNKDRSNALWLALE